MHAPAPSPSTLQCRATIALQRVPNNVATAPHALAAWQRATPGGSPGERGAVGSLLLARPPPAPIPAPLPPRPPSPLPFVAPTCRRSLPPHWAPYLTTLPSYSLPTYTLPSYFTLLHDPPTLPSHFALLQGFTCFYLTPTLTLTLTLTLLQGFTCFYIIVGVTYVFSVIAKARAPPRTLRPAPPRPGSNPLPRPGSNPPPRSG